MSESEQSHDFVVGKECSIVDGGIPFNEGYSFYYCSCGKWSTQQRGELAGREAHAKHLQDLLAQTK